MKNYFKKILTVALVALLIAGVVPFSAMAKEQADKSMPITSSSSTDKVTVVKGSATTSTPAKKEIPLLDFKESQITALYKAKSGDFLLSPVPDKEAFHKIVSSLANNPEAKLVNVDADKAAKYIEGSFIVVFNDGTRRVYALNTNNLLQAGNSYYQIPEESYKALGEVYQKDYKRANFAQWLIYMRPNMITEISYDNGSKVIDVPAENLSTIIQHIRGLRMVAGTSYSPKLDNFKTGGTKSKLTIKFGEDGRYDLLIDANTVYIESDELHIGCKHTAVSADLANLIKEIEKSVQSA